MPAKYENAIREAQRVLNENFVLRPPVDPYELATNEGLLVSEREFPTDVSNLAGYINIAEQVVVVNTLDALNRRKFTVAHELGHWILHAPALKSHPELGILNRTPLGRPDPEPRERETNAFAAHLLVPQDMLNEYQTSDVALLARVFAVSEQFMTYRLKHVYDFE